MKSLKFESFTKFKITSINPDLKMKKLWDFSLLFLTFINFFILPLEVCFFVKSPQNEIFSSYQIIHILKLFNVFVYGLDIILNFFTGFFYEGAIIKDLKMIRRKYLSRLFLYDLLAYIPIFAYVFETDLVDFNKNYLLLNIMFCFIFKKFNKIIKDFEEFLIQEKESFENFFSISCLYLKILLIAHVFACFWYLIGTYPPEKKSWLTVYGLESSSWDHQYLNSLYWSLVTMVTVGYGDITPQNNLEKIFCIIAMLVGFTIFGFTLGNLGDIIHKMNANEQEL